MLLGIGFGFVMNSIDGGNEIVTDWIKPFGTIFINLLKLIAVPLILASLIKGISDLKDISKIKKMGFRTIVIYVCTTIVAIIIGLSIVNTLNPGKGMSESTLEKIKAKYETSSGIMDKMKEAMKAKDTVALQALRSVKSAFLLAKTESGVKEDLTEEQEIKIIQKQVKQRKDSAAIFVEQGRNDLAKPELDEVAILEQFLPEALSTEEIESVVVNTISDIGASGMKDMGKVMGIVSKKLAGQADGKTISNIVKKNLMN